MKDKLEFKRAVSLTILSFSLGTVVTGVGFLDYYTGSTSIEDVVIRDTDNDGKEDAVCLYMQNGSSKTYLINSYTNSSGNIVYTWSDLIKLRNIERDRETGLVWQRINEKYRVLESKLGRIRDEK